MDVALFSDSVCVIASYDSCREDGEGDLRTNQLRPLYLQ